MRYSIGGIAAQRVVRVGTGIFEHVSRGMVARVAGYYTTELGLTPLGPGLRRWEQRGGEINMLFWSSNYGLHCGLYIFILY